MDSWPVGDFDFLKPLMNLERIERRLSFFEPPSFINAKRCAVFAGLFGKPGRPPCLLRAELTETTHDSAQSTSEGSLPKKISLARFRVQIRPESALLLVFWPSLALSRRAGFDVRRQTEKRMHLARIARRSLDPTFVPREQI